MTIYSECKLLFGVKLELEGAKVSESVEVYGFVYVLNMPCLSLWELRFLVACVEELAGSYATD